MGSGEINVDTQAIPKCEVMADWTPAVMTKVVKSDRNSNTWKAKLIRYANGLCAYVIG